MKKIATLCIMTLLCTLLFAGCGKKQEFPNPNLDSTQYMSGEHYVYMYIYNYGPIYMVLDADAAPATVTNFVRLVDEGFYDGLTFHRIIEGFMAQGGDPKGNGSGGSAFNLPGEFALNGFENPISHVRGTISMARTEDDYDSASSQFFIVQEDSVGLDGSYAAFGKVVHGMDIIDDMCADVPVKDKNGTVAKADQPYIYLAMSLSKETFDYLEKYDFNPPKEEEMEDTSFTVKMDMSAPDHGQSTVAQWSINPEAETYLLSANTDIAKISLYSYDLVTQSYDIEKPVASYEGLKANELIEVKLLVPEGIPAQIIVVEKTSGTKLPYLVMYDGFDGGARLAPLEDPTLN